MSRLSTTPFSILDLALAQHAEGLGFSRFWVAEHHNMEGIAVLLGYLAAGTSPLQLGSSGIMLPKHVPLAEKGTSFFGLIANKAQVGVCRLPANSGHLVFPGCTRIIPDEKKPRVAGLFFDQAS